MSLNINELEQSSTLENRIVIFQKEKATPISSNQRKVKTSTHNAGREKEKKNSTLNNESFVSAHNIYTYTIIHALRKKRQYKYRFGSNC